MVVSNVKELNEKMVRLAMCLRQGLLCRWLGQAGAADWYYIDADADGCVHGLSITLLYIKQMIRQQYLLKEINNVEGFTYIYSTHRS